jgi:N-acetylglucosaminyldiphosphoundecaprenol N-acetyl-beta-D-mannosaminyltransferase
VPGIDLMFGMLRRGNEGGYRVYCLGASQDVLDTVVKRIGVDFPGVKVAGSRNGYFKEAEDEEIAKTIAAAKPDILLVAMTSPKKEKFLARWSSVMGVPVCHGVGGSFDVYAGKVQRAPEVWQRLGLEWLYRVKQEPRRLWKRYLVTNVLFLGLIVSAIFRAQVAQPREGSHRH